MSPGCCSISHLPHFSLYLSLWVLSLRGKYAGRMGVSASARWPNCSCAEWRILRSRVEGRLRKIFAAALVCWAL